MEDYILLIHKYGYEHIYDGVTFKDTLEYLEQHSINVKDARMLDRIKVAFSVTYDHNPGLVPYLNEGGTHYTSILTLPIESYFRYLDYIDLKETREGSAKATKIAITAIVIGIVVGIAQIVTQVLTAH
jgi:hypothetical protein